MLRKLFCCLFLLTVSFVMLPVRAAAQTATESVLYSFCAPSSCSNTAGSISGPIQGADGNFYSTGGANVYKLTPSGTVTTIPVTSVYNGQVVPGLIQGSDGNFYGTGASGLFQVTPSGATKIVSADAGASGRLTQGADGNLYGIEAGSGVFFDVTEAGNYTPLYTFCNPNYSQQGCPYGAYPVGGVVQASDGNFYGVVTSGVSGNCFNCGGVFKISPSGTIDYGAGFQAQTPAIPQVLAEGASGLFGSTGYGANNYATEGAIFSESSSGLNLTYFFCFDQQPWECSDGSYPTGSLTMGPDGDLYGATQTGGTSNLGTIFKVTPATTALATLTTLYNFCSLANCADGSTPVGSLTFGSDGNIYGTTSAGGANNGGVIFKLALTPGLSAPVQMTLSSGTVEAGDSVTLSWSVPNAYSTTSQQCYGFVQNAATGAGTWAGLQTGTLTSGIYSGSATITPTAAGAYTYALTCGGTVTGFATLQVGGAKSATTTTLNSNSPVVLGGLVTLSAAATTTQSVGPLTGTVVFSYGSMSLGTVNVANGAANLNVTAQGIPTGTYRVTASYSGDSNYQPSVGTANVTVLGYGTATSLSASTGQVTQGQAVTLSSTVTRTAMSGTPSGSVTFSYGSHVLGTAKLVNGTASLTAATSGSIPPGTYGVTAKYDGDATDQTSVSAVVNVTVIAATATTLTVSPTTVPKDSAVTLTAVAKRKFNAGVPTGSVRFSVGSHYLGTQALDGTGTAVVNASSVGIAAGTYPVTATYSGDAANAASSDTVDVTVQ